MEIETEKCPECGEPLIIEGYNGGQYVSPRHFFYDDKWYCDEYCAESYLRRLIQGSVMEID
jgi:hypothetical protein